MALRDLRMMILSRVAVEIVLWSQVRVRDRVRGWVTSVLVSPLHRRFSLAHWRVFVGLFVGEERVIFSHGVVLVWVSLRVGVLV